MPCAGRARAELRASGQTAGKRDASTFSELPGQLRAQRATTSRGPAPLDDPPPKLLPELDEPDELELDEPDQPEDRHDEECSPPDEPLNQNCHQGRPKSVPAATARL